MLFNNKYSVGLEQYSAKSQKTKQAEVAMDMYKITHPEDNTNTDVRKNKNFAVKLTKAVKL